MFVLIAEGKPCWSDESGSRSRKRRRRPRIVNINNNYYRRPRELQPITTLTPIQPGQPLPQPGQPILGPNGQPILGPNGQPVLQPGPNPNLQPVLGPNGQPVLGPNGQPVFQPNPNFVNAISPIQDTLRVDPAPFTPTVQTYSYGQQNPSQPLGVVNPSPTYAGGGYYAQTYYQYV